MPKYALNILHRLQSVGIFLNLLPALLKYRRQRVYSALVHGAAVLTTRSLLLLTAQITRLSNAASLSSWKNPHTTKIKSKISNTVLKAIENVILKTSRTNVRKLIIAKRSNFVKRFLLYFILYHSLSDKRDFDTFL